MKPLREAQREVLAAVSPLPAERTPLDAALGLALAGPVTAPHDVPSFANSAMDGYAVRAADLAAVPCDLEVVGDLPAGAPEQFAVGQGQAVKIMTGAPLPDGADTVVRVEDTTFGDGVVRILRSHPAGTAVRAAGEDVPAGAVVLPAGDRLDASRLALLASLGVAAPVVRRRPRVAVLSTGDEVVPPDASDLRPGTIRDANRPLLKALLAELGATVIDGGIVGDDPDRLRGALLAAAAETDVVITSGGVSMGEYDLVKQVVADLGDVRMWQVAMKPGKPSAFGEIAGTPFFGLPGNPVSVLVTFEQLVRPALLTMMGATKRFRPRVPGILGTEIRSSPDRLEFVRVGLRFRDGWVAMPSGSQGSNIMSAAARADAFALIPAGVAGLAAGAVVELEMFHWPEALSAQEVLDE